MTYKIRQNSFISWHIVFGKKLHLFLTFAAFFFSMLSVRPLPAEIPLQSEVLSSLAIKKLVIGRTTEVNFVKTKEKGFLYFSPDGVVKQLKNNWLENGHWKVNERDRLCINMDGGSWACRMMIKDQEGVSQYIAKKDGNHQRELFYEKIYDGNKLLELAKLPFPPLEKLNTEEIVLLFSDKTVESETVRKGRVSLTYYSPDGTLELLRNRSTHIGSWRVTDNGRMCLYIANSQEKCRIIVKQGSSVSKYIVKKNGQHQQSIRYRRFMPGKQF